MLEDLNRIEITEPDILSGMTAANHALEASGSGFSLMMQVARLNPHGIGVSDAKIDLLWATLHNHNMQHPDLVMETYAAVLLQVPQDSLVRVMHGLEHRNPVSRAKTGEMDLIDPIHRMGDNLLKRVFWGRTSAWPSEDPAVTGAIVELGYRYQEAAYGRQREADSAVYSGQLLVGAAVVSSTFTRVA
jgi:hypothetical protein